MCRSWLNLWTAGDINCYSILKLHPEFRWMFQGFETCPVNSHEYITDFECTGTDKYLVHESMLSFYSGHSAFSFYAAWYTAVSFLPSFFRIARAYYDEMSIVKWMLVCLPVRLFSAVRKLECWNFVFSILDLVELKSGSSLLDPELWLQVSVWLCSFRTVRITKLVTWEIQFLSFLS